MLSLSRLAVDILEAHHAFIATATSALEHAKQAGELLIEAKNQLPHGEWLPWLEAHCPNLSPRRAQGYMRIAREWPRLLEVAANTKRDSLLPIRDALTILADEWTDPDELGAGGADDDDKDDDDKDDDESAKYTRMFQAFFEVNEYADFRQQFDEVKRLLRTHTDTDTLKKVVQLIHSALTTGENKMEDDAHDSTHRRQLDAGR